MTLLTSLPWSGKLPRWAWFRRWRTRRLLARLVAESRTGWVVHDAMQDYTIARCRMALGVPTTESLGEGR